MPGIVRTWFQLISTQMMEQCCGPRGSQALETGQFLPSHRSASLYIATARKRF